MATPPIDTSESYRLSWESVGQTRLVYYCNADPLFYKNVTQVVPNSEIPDDHCHPVSKETGDPWQQHAQLRKWADADEGFVRNVVLERLVGQPTWHALSDDDVFEIRAQLAAAGDEGTALAAATRLSERAASRLLDNGDGWIPGRDA